MNPVLTTLREKAATLPLTPGVYLMRDRNGRILYVGKSRKLRNRVTSYFVGTHDNYKTARMVEQVRDFDYILCDTEMEALTLENVLIKQHSPRYNIKLKDAKSYPYIKITAEEYPRVLVTRERRNDGARYFGPYQGSAAAHAAAETVLRLFSLPTCKRVFPRDIGRERPCIYRQMGRCIAPCTGGIPAEEYRARMRCAQTVLDGNIRQARRELTEAMQAAAAEERFEEAARLRDSIAALEHLSEKQKVVADESAEQDIFALWSEEICSVLAVLSVREGKLTEKREFLFRAGEIVDEGALTTFLCSYYSEGRALPREVLLQFSLGEEEVTLLTDYLTKIAGFRVRLHTPQRGARHDLCTLALTNAQQRAERFKQEIKREDTTLVRLASLLGLEVVPQRVEAYDISNYGTEHITGAMVVWEDGQLKKSDYRTFLIHTTAGIDDYGAMRETLTRRLQHIGDGTPSLGATPDLILLDGGASHVRVGREVLREKQLSIPLLGMVKDDYHKTRALTDGEQDIGIAKENEVYTFVYKLQEEVHRVAISRVRKAKRKTLKTSRLLAVPGIGPTKAKRLLTAFGSEKRVREATDAERAAVPGITERDAAAIRLYFEKAGEGKS